MTIQKLKFFLSPQIKKLLQKKWGSLSEEAKNIISEIIKDGEDYHNIAIKLAIQNDENFPEKLGEFLKKNKRKHLLEIEEEEQKKNLDEFENFNF